MRRPVSRLLFHTSIASTTRRMHLPSSIVTVVHPLEELSAQEISAAAESCKAYAAAQELGRLRFNVVTLKVCKRAFATQPQLP